MMEGQCGSCGKYLWDKKLYEQAQSLRDEVERLRLELDWFRAAVISEREACARSCELIAEEAHEVFDREGGVAASMCAVLIRARGVK